MNGPAPHTSAVVQATGGGNNLKRIIVIVFGLVLVLLLAELGYYFYTKSIQEKAANQGATPSGSGFPTAPPGAKSLNFEKAYLFVESLETSASRAELYKEAFFRRVLQGKVVSVEPEDTLLGGIKYVLAIIIEDEAGQSLRIHYNNKDIELSKVNIVSPNGDKEQIKLTDIKVGDFVVITEMLNFLDSSADIETAVDVTRTE